MVDTINSPNSNGSGQNPPANTPGNSFYSGFNRPDEVHVNLAGDHKEGVSTPQMSTTASIDGPNLTTSAQPQQGPVSPQPVIPQPTNPNPTPRPVYQDVKPAIQANPARAAQPATGSASASNQGVANFSEPISSQQISTTPKGGGKGPVLALLGGLVLIVIAGVATYFVAGTINQNKITQQNQEYKKLQSDLTKLRDTPAVLELPAVVPPQSDGAAPEVKKVETPVVQPTTPVAPEPTPAAPTVQPDGSQSAQG